MKKLISLLTILSALSIPFGTTTSVVADEPNASASPSASGASTNWKHRRGGPCRVDAEKFCPGLKLGAGLGKCLKEHRAELSSACGTKIAKVEEYRANRKERRGELQDERKEACAADVKQFCGGTERGKGDVIKCLRDNKAKLSEVCKATF